MSRKNNFEMYDFLTSTITRQEHRALQEHMKKCLERVRRDPVFARQILMQTGLYDKNGNLKPGVRHNCGLITCEPCPDYQTTRCPEYLI